MRKTVCLNLLLCALLFVAGIGADAQQALATRRVEKPKDQQVAHILRVVQRVHRVAAEKQRAKTDARLRFTLAEGKRVSRIVAEVTDPDEVYQLLLILRGMKANSYAGTQGYNDVIEWAYGDRLLFLSKDTSNEA